MSDEARLRAVAHGHGGGAVQLDDRRRVGAQEHVVEADDLRPVGGGGARRLGVHRGDRRLQRVGTEAPRRERPLHQRRRPRRSARGSRASDPDPPAGPARPPARRARARRDSCSSISASRPIASGSGSSSTSSRPSRIASAERSCRVSDGARRRGVALVEDQVDHVQHGVEPLRQLRPRRHLIGNARVADLRLGAHDALGQRGGGGEEGARDLLGGEAADLAQRQRHLRVRGQRGMAAGEDQPQPVVFDALVVALGGVTRGAPRVAPRARPATRRTGPAGASRRWP